jgi:hypothetical protein
VTGGVRQRGKLPYPDASTTGLATNRVRLIHQAEIRRNVRNGCDNEYTAMGVADF